MDRVVVDEWWKNLVDVVLVDVFDARMTCLTW